jgi:anti-anti-sigma factor
MEIKTREEGQVIIIALEGEVDISVTELVREKFNKLVDERKKVILVDMTKVSYIDSSGLGLLVETMQAMEKYSGEIKLYSLSSDVQKVFELTRLNKFFDIFNTEKEALGSLAKK